MTTAQEESRRAAQARAAAAAAARRKTRETAHHERAVHDLAAQMSTRPAAPAPTKEDHPIDPTLEPDHAATDRAWHHMRTAIGAPLTPPNVPPGTGTSDPMHDAATTAALAQMTNAVGVRLTSTN